MAVIFSYGSMIWYVLPIKDGMSWEGHLSGFLIGFCFAFLYRKKGIVHKEFQFTKTAFDEQFDENGNFIEFIERKEMNTEESKIENSDSTKH